jgi:hypothetical protein
MADINQIITLGTGDPADITHFLLVGLSLQSSPPPVGGEDQHTRTELGDERSFVTDHLILGGGGVSL